MRHSLSSYYNPFKITFIYTKIEFIVVHSNIVMNFIFNVKCFTDVNLLVVLALLYLL